VEAVGFGIQSDGMCADQLTSDGTESSRPTNDLDRKR